MEVGELRRLAIRLARERVVRMAGSDGVRCNECSSVTWCDGLYSNVIAMTHDPDCPIAELEAEEAASVKLSVGGVEFETVPCPAWKAQFIRESGDDWIAELTGNWKPITFDMKSGGSMTGWVRTMPTPEKPATKFEGEY